MWLPEFACPECRIALDAASACAACGRTYQCRDGVWRFLAASRKRRLDSFVAQYRAVREREGRRPIAADYYKALPVVPPDDPHAGEWRIRQETYRHLLRRVLAPGRQESAILDLGAGSGWLANRLSRFGHRVVAVDAMEDAADGLGAVRFYENPIVAIQADFDALPLVPGQFNLVIFNGSLHYALDIRATLDHARSMLAPSGAVVVMDSPMFEADADGHAMIADTVRRFAMEYGLRDIVQAGCGYLTFAMLSATARAFNMQTEFLPSRGPLTWRLRRRLSQITLGRQPAAFGLWVAQ